MSLWPNNLNSRAFDDALFKSNDVANAFSSLRQQMSINDDITPFLNTLYLPLAQWIFEKKSCSSNTLIVGINGAQGSGKSTFSQFLSLILKQAFALNTVVLSIDDLYKTRAQRERMAMGSHPLFQTRGVPGTHDTQLGIQLIQDIKELKAEHTLTYPSFDKGNDDRHAEQCWPSCQGKVDVVLFEGWCVGARAQDATDLTIPVNQLEKEEDTCGIWRATVNQHLQTDYKRLFALLDCLLFLKIPSFNMVFKWRGLQEHKLINQHQEENHLLSNDVVLQRFIAHYERLTRFQLSDIPNIADITFELGVDHQINRIVPH
jgi:D-glycerate 3-kinase